MIREPRGSWRPGHGAAVLVVILGATAAIRWAPGSPRAWLDLFFVPAVWGACTLGMSRGVAAALLACAAVFAMAATRAVHFGAGAGVPWLELGTWSLALVVASLLAGVLHRAALRRALDLGEAYRGTLDLMSRLIDSLERYSENHSRRVADYAVEVARDLGLSEAEVEDVRVSAFIHEIGKLDLPAEALARAAGLSAEELDDPRPYGSARGRHAPGGVLRHVVPIVTRLGERWDGTGRRALQGTHIPIGARIIAVADAYDTRVTDRAYKRGETREEALAAIQDLSGKQFDPRIVDLFLRRRGDDAGARAA